MPLWCKDLVELLGGIVFVAVDGADGRGKTIFADELAEVLQASGVTIIRASVDGFHNPPSVRYARGRSSPEGFYLDSYDYDALRRLLLDQRLPNGDGQIVRAIYEVHREQPVAQLVELAPLECVLVLDGVVLHREELRGHWDYSIFLDVDFAVSIRRCALRGRGDPEPRAESNRRDVEGQRLYLRLCRPDRHATVVIDNSTLETPRITTRNDSRPRVTNLAIAAAPHASAGGTARCEVVKRRLVTPYASEMSAPGFRLAESSDANTVARLLRVLGYDVPADSVAKRLDEFRRSRSDHVLLATVGAEIVGLISVSISPLLVEGAFARITALVVAEGQRRQGLGRALVAEAERIARAAGCSTIEVSSGTRPERADAHRLYSRLGYVDASRHHTLYERTLG